MKNLSLILSVLSLAGVITLFVMQSNGGRSEGKSVAVMGQASDIPAGSARIAYVNIDTLEAHYDYLKTRKTEFEDRQRKMEAELQRSAQQLQKDYMELQQKAQAGTLTQAESEQAQKRLMQGQQSLETRQQSMTEQLLKEHEEFNLEVQYLLDSFLTDYNKEKGYDFILTYTKGGQIMYAEKDLEITRDVIEGMNRITKSRNLSKQK
jgi:outer membrane protein